MGVTEPTLRWPADTDEPEPAPRDWRDTVRAASDLALLGIVTTAACMPVVTAGAAVASASAAVRDWCANDGMPAARTSLRRFGRGLLPGVGAALAGWALAGLLLLNASALARGVVPGGVPLLVATSAVVVLVAGLAGLTVVEVGREGGTGWLPAVRRASRTATARPHVPAALGCVVAVATFLALVLPVCAPLVVGYALLGLHVVAGRLAPPTP